MKKNYLDNVRKQFAYYQLLGQKTIDQLEAQDLFWQYNPESNSIAIIVQHLWGNMLSRFTDFLTADGEKEWRNREKEFEPYIEDAVEMQQKWDAGWQCVFAALDSVNEENFDSIVYIRNQGHTVLEALNRQLAHYAYHHIGRMQKDGLYWTNAKRTGMEKFIYS